MAGYTKLNTGPIADFASATGLRALPPASVIGSTFSLTSDCYGTVGWTIPGGYTVQYARKPGGWDMAGWPDASGAGVPVLSRSGGVMTATLVSPGVFEISGDYAETISGWHPSNEGSNLITCCTAGVGALWTPIASTTSGVQPAKTRPLIWAPEWGNAGWYWDGSNNDPDNTAPGFQTDAAWPTRKSYLMRSPAGTIRNLKCTTFPAAGAAFSVYMAGRWFNNAEDFGSGGQGLPVLNGAAAGLILDDQALGAGWSGGTLGTIPGGLMWVNSAVTNGKAYWQCVRKDSSPKLFGGKTSGDNAVELSTANTPWLVQLEVTAGGKPSIYVGSTLVSDEPATATPWVSNTMRFGGALPLNLHGICVIQNVPADSTARTARLNYFKARWGVA